MFISDIEEATSALSARDFNPESFVTDLFAAYGANPTTITKLRGGNLNKSDVPGGVLWGLKARAAVCQAGAAAATVERLAQSKMTEKHKARFVLATDGEEVVARDLKREDALSCSFAELGDCFGFLLPLAGHERYAASGENPVEVKAANASRRSTTP